MVDGDDSKQVVTSGSKSEGMTVVSPYSLFSSDNPGALITSVQLKGDNYNEWAMEMLNALRAKKTNGFIDGTLPKPAEDSPDLESWLSVNSMIVGWIRSSIEPRVRSTVTFITEASKLWENLKKRFEVGNKVRIHQLMEQLASCRQNGQPVIDYYGRLAVMWEELQTYRPPPVCSCSAAAVYEKEREDERVHQFIMGLDESRFGNVVTAIIESDELADLGRVYAKVIREEARLNSAKSREVVAQEAVGFAARTAGDKEVKEERDSGGLTTRSDNNNSAYGNRARDRVCSNCGKTGHEKNNCWQIIGYPEWMNERRGRGSSRGRGGSGTRGGGRGAALTAHASSSYGTNAGADLTPE